MEDLEFVQLEQGWTNILAGGQHHVSDTVRWGWGKFIYISNLDTFIKFT